MVAMLSIKFLSFDVLEVSMMDHNLLTSPELESFSPKYHFCSLFRLLGLLQAINPQKQSLHLQGLRRPQGEVSYRQDPPEPVPGLSAEEVLREQHEQGRGPARERAPEAEGDEGRLPGSRSDQLRLPAPQQALGLGPDVRLQPLSVRVGRDVPQDLPRP